MSSTFFWNIAHELRGTLYSNASTAPVKVQLVTGSSRMVALQPPLTLSLSMFAQTFTSESREPRDLHRRFPLNFQATGAGDILLLGDDNLTDFLLIRYKYSILQ